MTDLRPYELTDDDVARLDAAEADVEQDAIVVRPHQDNSGIPGMDEVLRSLPRADTETSGLLRRREQNTSAPFAFEMRYAPDPFVSSPTSERVLSLQYVGGDERTSELLGRQLPDKYPDSRTEHRDATWLTPDEGQHIAAATLGLRRYTLYPLKNINLDEFRSDPTGSILTEMVGAADAGGVDADVAVQVMARPAGTDWKSGVPGGYGLAGEYGDGLTQTETKVTSPHSTEKLRWFLNQPTHERRAILPTPVGSALGWAHPFFRDEFEHPPSKADKQAAKMLSDLDGRGWEFHVRIVAVSDDADLAQERVASTAEMFDNFYEYRGAQTFVPIPQNGRDAVDVATAAAGREWPADPEQRMVKPQIEVAGLTNIPEAEHVSTNKLRWALASPGEGIPPGTARFNYDTHGLDAGTASRAEKQIAMLEAAGGDEPLWYGTGVKYGTEAGVFQDTLYHQFVGGATRQGKTTLLTNFVGQGYRADGGGLVIDPKGLDADEFLAEWPEDRPAEDVVVMDLTGDYGRIPRFNFMEIPEYLEAGTRAHSSYCEALAEDILAMVAEAGGSDNYLGALMKRVVKAVVRGLARADMTATLLDVAAVCASSDNLSRFRQQMDEERFAFLRDTAERLEERDDTDLEPLAGRMDEWVLNENVRELICARESSFSINDLVDDGKWLIVGFDKASSETEVTMVGTALIRRTYFAQRHHNPDHPFDLICDEFDRIASEQSNIHQILSEAAAFDYRCTLACQAPTNQLPERVRHAIENQCGTFLSFNPGGGKDAAWISQQHTVDKEELLNLPRYKFYMRATTRDDDFTHSFMVEGFPPARETRGDPRDEDDIRELKLASLDVYGTEVESLDEQRAASPYLDDDALPDGEADDVQEDTADGNQERAILKAVFDESIHRDGVDPGGYVAADEVEPRIREYLGTTSEDSKSQVWAPVERVPSNLLERKTRDGLEHLRTTERGERQLYSTGESENEGGIEHRSLLREAYIPLTQLGLCVDIVEQDGDELPDAEARPESLRGVDTDDLSWREVSEVYDSLEAEEPLVAQLTDGETVPIEAESSTGRSKPGQTVRNLAQAITAGERCILLAKPDDARIVENALTDPPFLHSQDDEADRFYNRRYLTIDGEDVLRPAGPSHSVWRYDHATDTYTLTDSGADDVVHARFEDPEAIFVDADAYPATESDVEDPEAWVQVKKPVIPDLVFDGDLPDREDWNLIQHDPEASGSGLALRTGDGAEQLAVGDDQEDDDDGDHDADAHLDTDEVSDQAAALYRLLHDHPEMPVTVSEAHEIATDSGNDQLDKARRTVSDWVSQLTDVGALVEGDYRAQEGREYQVPKE